MVAANKGDFFSDKPKKDKKTNPHDKFDFEDIPGHTPVHWMSSQHNEHFVNRKDLINFLRNDSNKELKKIPGAIYISEWLQCILEEIGEPEGHEEDDTGEYVWNNDASLRYVVGGEGVYIKHSDLCNLLDMKAKREKEADFTQSGVEYNQAKLAYMLSEGTPIKPRKD